MNRSLGACRTLKDLDLRLIVGYSSKSMISYREPNGYEDKEHGAKVKAIRSHVNHTRCNVFVTSKSQDREFTSPEGEDGARRPHPSGWG